MRQPGFLAAIVLIVSFVQRAQCLSAISGSPCYDSCDGDSATSSNDIVCLDSDWNSQKGQTLSQCMTCLQSSTFRQGPMTDEILFMYYLSTVQQTCLSGTPGVPISNCSDQCDTVDSAFSGLGGRTFFQSPYSYCSANSNAYTSDALGCSTCLASQDGVVTLSNFVYTGNTACAQQPDLENEDALSFATNLFATTPLVGPVSSTASSATKTASTVSGTATSATSTSSTAADPTSSTGTSSPSSTSASHKATGTASSSNSHDGENSKDAGESDGQGLSRGAAAGIGIALGIIGVALIVFLAIFARRRMLAKQGEAGPFSKMRDSPEMRQASGALPQAMPLPAELDRGATPPAAGVFVPPVAQPKSSKSFKSSKTWKSMTPRTSEWFWAANPKQSSELSALPQRGWD